MVKGEVAMLVIIRGLHRRNKPKRRQNVECVRCGHTLSSYNAGEYCWPCLQNHWYEIIDHRCGGLGE